MDALIEVSSNEFNEELFKKIKSLIKNLGNGALTIKVNNGESRLFRNETEAEYWDRIREAGEEIKQGKGIVFTMDELTEYVHNLAGK